MSPGFLIMKTGECEHSHQKTGRRGDAKSKLGVESTQFEAISNCGCPLCSWKERVKHKDFYTHMEYYSAFKKK